MRRAIMAGLVGIAVLSGFAIRSADAAQLQYSANQVTTVTNDGKTQTTRSRIHVGNQKIREDILSGPAASMIMIVRMDKKVFYQLNPSRKTALELPFKVSASQRMMMDESQNHFRKVGRETVAGTLCDKYEMKDEGKLVGYMWKSVDSQIPVKVRSADGKVVTLLSDFKAGSQPDALFEVPGGYRTMNMQGFGGMMGHGLGGMMHGMP